MFMPSLPQEMVDHIVGFIHDDREALKQCCLVSRSWAHRTRPRLFNDVCFKTPEAFSAWKKNIPPYLDPAESPAIYTHSLSFHHAELVTNNDVNWIRSFTNVVRLEVRIVKPYNSRRGRTRSQNFAPFHDLLPTVKSLSLRWYTLLQREVFDFICSFRLLENLELSGYGSLRAVGGEGAVSPCLPVSIGTLVLKTTLGDFARRLLELPYLPHLRKIVWNVQRGNFRFKPVKALVERCSDTLEYICIDCWGHLDLTRAKKLKEVEFRHPIYYAAQIASTLDTIKHGHDRFERVLIHLPFPSQGRTPVTFRWPTEELNSQGKVLDCALVQLGFRVSPQICVKPVWNGGGKIVGGEHLHYIKLRLPETWSKGDIKVLGDEGFTF